ncbi:histone-lysine N-methyltransferase SETMAR-like [Vespa crabro]|uniref:histone-lysine N-methyltransferase SETMAR-like n=1 Tax=Vespa crabro TaxID=7445 RepID=UPI001F029798|nr:histone-lysine N-methyltransferase SETMAR-like [Vespa crabro]
MPQEQVRLTVLEMFQKDDGMLLYWVVRKIISFFADRGFNCKNAVHTRKKLTDVYGEDVLTVRQCQKWFAKFGSGTFVVEDAPRSRRPVESYEDTIKTLIDANRRITTREFGESLNLSNSTVYDHLKCLGITPKLEMWVSHVLTERNLYRHVEVYDSFLERHENDPFLKRIITRDEKWVVYINVKRKISRNKKDEPARSISKVDKLNGALQQKKPKLINRKGVVFHQDNARPHTSLVSRQKLLQLEWDTIPHPPYSPDLARSDYYVSLQNFLDSKTITSNKESRESYGSASRTNATIGLRNIPTRRDKTMKVPQEPMRITDISILR